MSRGQFYRDYLRSPEWAAIRRMALAEADHACIFCDRTTGLQVHHRTYKRLGQELLRDLTVLCSECHERHHGLLPPAPADIPGDRPQTPLYAFPTAEQARRVIWRPRTPLSEIFALDEPDGQQEAA